MRRTHAVLLATTTATLLAAVPAGAATTTLVTTMKGANERPAVGDADGSGAVTLTLDTTKKRICMDITAVKIGTPVAGHIHMGRAGVQGAVFIDLKVTSRHRRGCVSATRAQINAIVASPSGYYVNLHTAALPNGAIRGQLKRKTR